jgi:hypothetical protein
VTVRVAIVASNQAGNEYKGMSGISEETWSREVCSRVKSRLIEHGAEAEVFWKAGAIPSLNEMIASAIAWQPTYMLSVHSDAVGDKAQTGILLLMAREVDRYVGIQLCRAIATNLGLPCKGTWVYGNEARKINYLAALRKHELEGCLVEVGEHATAAEAEWNWTHIKEIGTGIADALAEYLGVTGVEHMTDEQVKLQKMTAVWALESKWDSLICKMYLKGAPETALAMEAQRAEGVKALKEQLGVE